MNQRKRFVIKYDANDEELAKVYSGEMQRVVSSVYERSRQIVLEQLEYDQVNKRNQDDQVLEFLRSHEVYFTKEEAKEFARMIRQFVAKRSESEEAERQKYHFFGVLRPIHKDK